MVGFVCALRRRRIVCWVIRRVRIIRVVIYWRAGRRGKVVRLGKEAGVVGMGSGWGRAIVGAVGASGIGRILLACCCLSMLISVWARGGLTSSFGFLFGLLTVSSFRCLMCSQASHASYCCCFCDSSCSALTPAPAPTAASTTRR